MIEPSRRPNESSKILKYDRNPNYGLVDTPIIWTAPKSQAKIYRKTQLLESRLALINPWINFNPVPSCLKAD